MNNETIKLTKSQKELIQTFIDKLQVNDKNELSINVKTINESLQEDIKSTRSRLSSVNLKKLFIYHTQTMVGASNEPYIELKSNFTIDYVKSLLDTNETKANND